MIRLDVAKTRAIIRLALKEDVGKGDITTNSLIPAATMAHGKFLTCEPCIVAGLSIIKIVFGELSRNVKVIPRVKEGSRITANKAIAEIVGPARAILTGERAALNFLQRLSGIATYTAQFVEKAKKYGVKIKDTRKTTPCLRYLEKYAVRVGGGENHRMGLYDAVLIKDNHLSMMSGKDIRTAIERLRNNNPGVRIEVEAETLKQVKAALSANADIVMLDNMSNKMMKKAVKIIEGRAIIEASGRMSLDRITGVAALGVDWISIGALTSSAPSIDIKLELK